jgi:hypothetical protein
MLSSAACGIVREVIGYPAGQTLLALSRLRSTLAQDL